MRRFEEVVTFHADDFVWSQTGDGGPGRIHERDIEIFVDLHDRCRDNIKVGLHLSEPGFGLFFVGNILEVYDCATGVGAV